MNTYVRIEQIENGFIVEVDNDDYEKSYYCADMTELTAKLVEVYGNA